MKIYIDNFNLDIIEDIAKLLKEYFIEDKNYSTLYTDDHIYIIEKSNVYKLDTVDKEVKIYNRYYNDFNLIVDTSYFNKNLVNGIHGFTHYYYNVSEHIYKLNKQSNLKLILVVKTHSENTKKIYDIYFEYEKDSDINEIFIKQELIEFLSVLN